MYENIIDALEKTKAKPIIHSDHGVEYTNHRYADIKNKYGFTQSMVRPGKSLDNRPIEYFFGILKSECTRQIEVNKKTPQYLEKSINEYIKWYNNERIVFHLETSPKKYKAKF